MASLVNDAFLHVRTSLPHIFQHDRNPVSTRCVRERQPERSCGLREALSIGGIADQWDEIEMRDVDRRSNSDGSRQCGLVTFPANANNGRIRARDVQIEERSVENHRRMSIKGSRVAFNTLIEMRVQPFRICESCHLHANVLLTTKRDAGVKLLFEYVYGNVSHHLFSSIACRVTAPDHRFEAEPGVEAPSLGSPCVRFDLTAHHSETRLIKIKRPLAYRLGRFQIAVEKQSVLRHLVGVPWNVHQPIEDLLNKTLDCSATYGQPGAIADHIGVLVLSSQNVLNLEHLI